MIFAISDGEKQRTAKTSLRRGWHQFVSHHLHNACNKHIDKLQLRPADARPQHIEHHLPTNEAIGQTHQSRSIGICTAAQLSPVHNRRRIT